MPEVTWRSNPGPQQAMIACPVFEVFFGGARGGGKTAGVLGDWAVHASLYGEKANGLMVRRSLVELQDTIRESKAMYFPIGASYNETGKRWVMPNGAVLTFAFLENDEDAQRFQGWNLSRLYVEEVGNFPNPDPIMKLKATLRAKGTQVGLRLTGNPGGPGHQWVKARYVDPAPSGYTIITDSYGLERIFIPSKVQDNPALLASDPTYIQRLKASGSKELVRAWLEGDWSVITGAYFPEFSMAQHVIPTLSVPEHWTRIRGMDWGSAAPFCVLWAAVSDGEPVGQYYLPKNSLVVYREWYGWNGEPNKGCGMMAQEVGAQIRYLERDDRDMDDEVLDPAAFSSDGGPSIAERLDLNFRRADNKRIQRLGVSGGWDAVRERLRGTDQSEHKPLIYFMDNCVHTIRTLPALQHDMMRPEDVDTTGEDHCFTSDTCVRTEKGVFSLAELIGKTGRIRSHDGLFHDFRSVRMTRANQPIVKLSFSDGSHVRCTRNHLFLTNQGWVQAQDLLGLQTLRCCPIRARNFWADAIICVARIFVPKARFSIGMSGLRLMDRFQKVGIFITKTITKLIIQSITWTVCRAQISWVANTAKNLPNGRCSILSEPETPQSFGTNRMRVGNGINRTISMLKPHFMQQMRSYVNSATSHLLESLISFFVIPTVSSVGGLTAAVTIFKENVQFVERDLLPISTQRSKPVRVPAASFPALMPGVACVEIKEAPPADVYCLTVPDTGNFGLENGAIVANCGDTVRYICMSRPLQRKIVQVENRRYELTSLKGPTFNELVKRNREKRLEREGMM